MILVVSLFLYVLYSACKEGYINKPLQNEPDDIQFLACHDYSSNQNLGNNNYKLKRHGVSEPILGTYSFLLDTYKIRSHDEIFHSPICEEEYQFKDIGNLKVPKILDHEDILKEKEMLDIEDDYEMNSIKEPYYLYVSPKYIGNKLTYSDATNEMFLDTHHSQQGGNGPAHRIHTDIPT
tara:strand:- start:116 stop:652 length:537 start_codon:yes stop_codon:yes gene_type:complete